MDYIKKNYEKLIFSVLLVVFIFALVWLINNFANIDKSELEFNAKPAKPRLDFTKTEIIAKYNLAAKMGEIAVIEKIPGARVTRSGLLSPVPMAICPNPVGKPYEVTDPRTGKTVMQQKLCNHLIPRALFMDGKRCPYCGGELHKPSEAKIGSVDSDSDGIPDQDETEAGLSPTDPKDAFEDLDGDGFSNIVEYTGEAGAVTLDKSSDMVDPKSHPSLAYRLYVKSIRQTLIPIAVKKVEAYGKNKKAWSALIEYSHPKGKRTEYFSIGQDVILKNTKYTIVDIIPKVVLRLDETVNRKMKFDESIVVLSSKKYKNIQAVVSKPLYEPAKKAKLVDRANHKSYTVRLTDKLTLGDDNVGFEEFNVKVIDDKKGTVTLGDVTNKTEFIIFDKQNAPKINDTEEEGATVDNSKIIF